MEGGFPLYVVLVLRCGAIGSAADSDSDSDGSKFESWYRSIIVISIVLLGESGGRNPLRVGLTPIR